MGKLGQSPGTLTFVGEKRQEQARVTVWQYNATQLKSVDATDLDALDTKGAMITWVDVTGLHDLDLISRIGSRFAIHPLALEDILNTDHRPKVEELPDYLFLVAKRGTWTPQNTVELEQVTLILGEQVVISFREVEAGTFDGVRSRLEGARGRIRSKGSDYLACALLDACVDQYYLVADAADEKVAELEESLLLDPDEEQLKTVHRLKTQLSRLRRTLWPLRELTSEMVRGDFDSIREETEPFFRDVHDHVVQVTETVDTLIDTLTGLMDLVLSSMSHRMNEVMKVLTIIATIFIPLTFLAGLYGMNFKFMPELEWKWGYPVVLLVMLVSVVLMLIYFRRKKWI